jgi:hypothetical protein
MGLIEGFLMGVGVFIASIIIAIILVYIIR